MNFSPIQIASTWVIALFLSATPNFAAPLHDAVKSSDIELVKRFLREDFETLNERDEEGQTAVHWSVILANPSIFSTLVLAGADYTLENRLGQTPQFLSSQLSTSRESLLIQAGFKRLISERPVLKLPTLIAVHQTSQFVPSPDSPNSESYIMHSNHIISKMAQLGYPVVYLTSGDIQDPTDFRYWRTGLDIQPTIRVYSAGGEHDLALPTSEVVIIGANWGYCHFHAATKAIRQHFASNSNPFIIHLPVQAIHVSPNPHGRKILEFLDTDQKLKEVKETFLLDGEFEEFRYNGQRYEFTLFVDGIQLETFGRGSKKVYLKIWNSFEPALNLETPADHDEL